jgi:hypothetical protein
VTENVPLYTTPRDRQEGGDHYLNMGIQPWDAMWFWLSPEQFTRIARDAPAFMPGRMSKVAHALAAQKTRRKTRRTCARRGFLPVYCALIVGRSPGFFKQPWSLSSDSTGIE